VHSIDDLGIAQQRKINPAAAPWTPSDRSIFVAFGPQLIADFTVNFRGKWPRSYARAIGLGDADHVRNCIGSDARASNGPTRGCAGRSNKRIGPMVNVEHGSLRAFKHHGFSRSDGL